MASEGSSTVFLAGSAVELISASACLVGLGITQAVVFIERNISFQTEGIDPLLAAVRHRFPSVRFVELEIKRPPRGKLSARLRWKSLLWRWTAARSIHNQLDEACHVNFGVRLNAFGNRVQEVCFTTLHDYVLVFLASCPESARVFYPHSFDHPRRGQVRDYGYLVRGRSPRTAIGTIAQQGTRFGLGGLSLGALGHLLPGITTVSLPFSGVDRVLTFRSGIDYVPNEIMKVSGLQETFRWLLSLEPWSTLLKDRKKRGKGNSLLLLLPECNRHPIWEKNRNYGPAHLKLLRVVSQSTGLRRFVLKAHVRSDISAALWLASFVQEQEKEWDIEILPLELSGLPVEALSLTDEFAAACSLGSCSLPPGLGFGIPHYVSLEACVLFDQGWQEPFWVKYRDAAYLLMEEGICQSIDAKSVSGAAVGKESNAKFQQLAQS